MRFQAPRALRATETADSLAHWKTQFEVYITSRLIFLAHICSFFEYPYYNQKIQERSTSWKNIYTQLQDIYNIEKTAKSVMGLGTVKKLSTELYAVFYAKILYLMEQNLAPANKTVDEVSTGETRDKLTVSNMEHAAVIWILLIDPRLFDKIETEYAAQIRAGKLLSELVPQIAKAIPRMLKSLNGARKEVVNAIKDLELGDDDDKDDHHDGDDPDSANINYVGNNRNKRGRGGQRGNSRNNRGPGRFKNKPTCNHCNWLKTFWKISEVDANHNTKECTRNFSKEVRAIIDEEMANAAGALSASSEEGLHTHQESTSSHPYFQKVNRQPDPGQPPGKMAQEKTEEIKENPINLLLSDKNVLRIKIRALRLTRKAASPKILVTFNNKRVVLLVDKGAEINCIDADFAASNDIRLEHSSESDKSAGNKSLSILGQTTDDVYEDTLFQSTHVSINLGRAIVIQNLGADMILGEPGKASNSISIDPKNRMIFVDREGKVMTKPYFDQLGTTSSICRVETAGTTVFPEDSHHVRGSGTPAQLRHRDHPEA